MYNLKEIQDFLEKVSKLNLHKIDLKTENLKLSVQIKPDNTYIESKQNYVEKINNSTDSESKKIEEIIIEQPKPNEKISSDELITIKSTMVGTFYRRPKPESNPFVEVGQKIKIGDIICVIEAMKLFNEIESEISGEIVKILVEDASPVEYDQPLFIVKPL